MVTSAPTFRMILFPLAFAALCIALAIGVFRAFGGAVPFQADRYTILVDVPEGDSIFPNSDVRMAGVTVGKVVKIDSLRNRAGLELELDPEYVPLREQARAIVRNKSLLGEGYLEVAPGPKSAKALPDGGRLASAQVDRAQRLDDVLQTFDPRTRGQLREMASGVDRAFRGRAANLNQILGTARPATADIGTIVRSLDDQQTEVRELLANSSDVFAAVGRQSGALQSAISQGRQVFAATADRDVALRRTLDEIPPFVRNLRDASVGIDGASGDIRTAVTSLRPTVALLEPALVSLADDTTAFKDVFAKVSPVLDTGTRSLPAVTRTLDAVGPPLDRIHMAARQLLPFMELAAADRESILANFANVAATWNGRQIFPGGKEHGYLSAWLTAWNEITGGWTKKLPTNRSNPYPKPGPIGPSFASGGLLAYDCRNVNNPLILPPFGAAPPCKTQGPYEFKGKQVYYPRLELPAP